MITMTTFVIVAEFFFYFGCDERRKQRNAISTQFEGELVNDFHK